MKTARRELLAWAFYDFANSSFTTVIVTVVYSVYFIQVVAPGGEALWGRTYALSMIVVGLLSPPLGALADATGRKKIFLFVFTLLCILPTGLLYFVGPGDRAAGMILFALANVGYNGALVFYDSFLKEISPPEETGRVSGFGWAFGYVGGLLSLAAVYPFVWRGFGEEHRSAVRLAFPITALFFAIASIPTFAVLRDRPKSGTFSLFAGIGRIRETLANLSRFRQLTRFFLAYLFYNDGINTVIVFSAVFASVVLGFSTSELILLFILIQVTAAAGAYLLASPVDRFGPRRVIVATLLFWSFISLWAFVVQSKSEFFLLAMIAGLGIGSAQSASRSLLVLFAPASKTAEFFGFFSLMGKVSATLGPLLYGEVAVRTGSHRWAVLSLLPFFLLGLALLLRVDEKEGIAAAKASDF